jgi:hypothetical protein
MSIPETMQAPSSNGRRTALTTGLTAAGGGGAVWLMARRARKRHQRKAAERAARQTVNRVQDMARDLPERWSETVTERLDDERWRIWAVTFAVLAWVIFRMAELRQLRRLNRAMAPAASL